MEHDEKARETLGINKGQWIIGFNDEELVLLKAALRVHTELANSLLNKVEKVG